MLSKTEAPHTVFLRFEHRNNILEHCYVTICLIDVRQLYTLSGFRVSSFVTE